MPLSPLLGHSCLSPRQADAAGAEGLEVPLYHQSLKGLSRTLPARSHPKSTSLYSSSLKEGFKPEGERQKKRSMQAGREELVFIVTVYRAGCPPHHWPRGSRQQDGPGDPATVSVKASGFMSTVGSTFSHEVHT